MKKLLLIVPFVALIAAGCNSSPQVSSQTPVATPVAQNTNPTPTLTSAPGPTASPDPTANWKTYTNATYGFQFKYPQQDYLYGNFLNASGSGSSEKNDPQMESLNAGMTLVGTPYLSVDVTALDGLPLNRNVVYNNARDIDPIIQQDLITEKIGLESTPVGGSFPDSNDPAADGIRAKLYEVIIPVGSTKVDAFVGSETQAADVVFNLLAFNSHGDRIEIEDTNTSSNLNNEFIANLSAPGLTASQVEADPSWQQFLLIARSFQLTATK